MMDPEKVGSDYGRSPGPRPAVAISSPLGHCFGLRVPSTSAIPSWRTKMASIRESPASASEVQHAAEQTPLLVGGHDRNSNVFEVAPMKYGTLLQYLS